MKHPGTHSLFFQKTEKIDSVRKCSDSVALKLCIRKSSNSCSAQCSLFSLHKEKRKREKARPFYGSKHSKHVASWFRSAFSMASIYCWLDHKHEKRVNKTKMNESDDNNNNDGGRLKRVNWKWIKCRKFNPTISCTKRNVYTIHMHMVHVLLLLIRTRVKRQIRLAGLAFSL